MSLTAHDSILPWHIGRADNATRPVGRRDINPRSHTATLVEEVNHEIVYGPEVPISVFASEVRDLPPAVEARLGIPRMRAWLFEAFDLTPSGRLHGHSVTFSALPFSQNRHFRGVLRRASHARADHLYAELLKHIERASEALDPEEALQSALDDMATTPFISDKAMVAAWMFSPKQFAGLGAGRMDARRDYAIGICADPQRCMDLLKIDERVAKLFEWTDDGSLLSKLPNVRPQGRGPIAHPVSDVARDNKELILDMAVTLSLAGPLDDDLLAQQKAAPLPVFRQVERLYRHIVYKWSAYPPDVLPDDYFDNVAAQLREAGPQRTIPGLIAKLTTTKPGRSALLNLIALCPAAWVLPPPLIDFLTRSLGFLESASQVHGLVRARLLAAARQTPPA